MTLSKEEENLDYLITKLTSPEVIESMIIRLKEANEFIEELKESRKVSLKQLQEPITI